MHPIRLISRLDIKGPNVIKGIHLEGLRVVGKPGDLARAYYKDGIDEILYMDTVASLYGRSSIFGVIEETARDVFVPITIGGGIRTVDDFKQALRCGADKVAVNTAAVKRPEFIRETAAAFGSQCVVLSIEAKRHAPGQWEALCDNGRETTGKDVLAWVQEAVSLGAGEIVLTSVDMEGTKKGFDMDLITRVRELVEVPVIACGGAGKAEHISAAFLNGNVDAVACASMFHYKLATVSELKSSLHDSGVPVRLS
ncbi:MAG: imidazole glycerol phosphate synthase subunit HisF [Alphaproteobacteria bacterium]|nr:imidazole glycerol phosphate synthase subunit HisF [Alphaproteobacteria bacterium]MBO6861266.1 imidazole glycerol phosphate synthase subunit HisF [Alphaproteobacteria bacterium]